MEPSLQIAERIVRGMQLFGAYKDEEAIEFVGELGWKVVQKTEDGKRCATIQILNILV